MFYGALNFNAENFKIIFKVLKHSVRMKLSDTFPQHKFFEGICFFHKCKPETNLTVLLFFFIELVTQMTVIDCTRLLTNPY